MDETRFGMDARPRQEERPLTSKIHIVITTLVIMTGMGVLDGYLVEQNYGSRRTGVFVMLLIGDVCLLLVLRYVALWVGTEVKTTKRGCSMIEWFLFIFVLDIKMYFILESVRKDCSSLGFMLESAPLQSPEDVAPDDPIRVTRNLQETVHQQDYDPDPLLESVPYEPYEQCEYTLSAKKMLTLFQGVLIAGLYLLLVGADHLKNISSFRELEEVKMRTFWVVIDLLDIVDLQSSMWEANQSELPYLVEGFVYFYCYLVLIVLPPLSLAEMCKGGEEEVLRPHRMLIYLVGSMCVVNVGSTAIRLVLLFRHNFRATSSIFIAKNVICLGMKITKLIQIRMIRAGRLQFGQTSRRSSMVANGNAIRCRNVSSELEMTSERGDEGEKVIGATTQVCDNTYQYGTWKESDGTFTEAALACNNVALPRSKARSTASDTSTFAGAQGRCDSCQGELDGIYQQSQSGCDEAKLRKVTFDGKRGRRANSALNHASTTSGSETGSCSGCANVHRRRLNDHRQANGAAIMPLPRSMENLFSAAGQHSGAHTLPHQIAAVSTASCGRNRHSYAPRSSDCFGPTPSGYVVACPHASRSTGDMTFLGAAVTSSAPADFRFDQREAESSSSESETSDMAPQPPSMELLVGNGRCQMTASASKDQLSDGSTSV